MLPDFINPAFAFVALCGVRFQSRSEGGHAVTFRSDYRCQLRYVDDTEEADADVRTYFVGHENASAGDEMAIVLAFVDWERERDRCRVGRAFELREGTVVTATGVVRGIARR